MPGNKDLDEIDLKILTILMEDANRPYTDIAKEVFVSSGTVHVRMRKMEKMGIIKRAELIIDYSKVGYDINAFLGVYLRESSLFDQVVNELKAIPEVLNVNYTTGNYGIFARILCKDTQHLMEVLNNKIQKVTGIERTETFISLKESFRRPLRLI